MAISKQDIINVANELSSKGEKVTQVTVREVLGSGSFTTIAEALKEWRATQEEPVEASRAELPQELESKIQTLGIALWESAQDLSNKQVAEERQLLKQLKTELLVDVEQSKEAILVMEREEEVYKEKIISLEGLVKDNKELSDQSTQKSLSIEKLELALADVNKAHSSLQETAKLEKDAITKQLLDKTEEINSLKQKNANLLGKVEVLESNIKDTNIKLADAQKLLTEKDVTIQIQSAELLKLKEEPSKAPAKPTADAKKAEPSKAPAKPTADAKKAEPSKAPAKPTADAKKAEPSKAPAEAKPIIETNANKK